MPAGQFLWIEILKALQPDHLDQRAALRLGVCIFHALLARAVHDVPKHGFPGKQRKLLKYRTTVGTLGPLIVFPFIFALASGRLHEAPNDVEQRRFPQPEGPRIETKAPSSTVSEMSDNAR